MSNFLDRARLKSQGSRDRRFVRVQGTEQGDDPNQQQEYGEIIPAGELDQA
jgi:hypothetical protein